MKEALVTRPVFRFEELSPTAQDRALEVLREQAWECLDSDMVSEDISFMFAMTANSKWDQGVLSVKELKDKFGVRIYWSVSYSQSDGGQIEGYLDRDICPDLKWPNDVRAIRASSNNFYGSTILDVFVGDEYDDAREQSDWDAAREMVDNLNGDIYQWARTACETYTSAEYVMDQYQDSGLPYQFDEDGNQAPMMFWEAE
jgi:hypothetical protein